MTSQINCLIADDEPIAREIIQNYCVHLPQLQVIATCENGIQAKALLQQEHIDLLFLDINMPILDGISLLKTIKHLPQIIFTTAYKEYAVEAFDLAACDYLLKPFSLDRFIIAVDKAIDRIQSSVRSTNETAIVDPGQSIFIRSEGKIYKIVFDEVLYAEANGNYIKIITHKQTISAGMTFSSLCDLLPESIFLRLHRSFIINKSKISHIEGNRVFILNKEIPIGSNYRDHFFSSLGLKSIE